jgi:DNA sulfur modification protein DndD
MSDRKETGWLRALEETVAGEKGISPDTLRRLLAKVEEHSESHRAFGLHDELLAILQADLRRAPGPENPGVLCNPCNPCASEIFIDSLTLENFGPFYGEHTFNFGTLEHRCGILIGGKTGAGKSHLLRALYLAVVGEAGVFDLKKVEPGSEATRFLFENSLNRRAQAEGRDTIRLQVGISQREADGGGRRNALLVREIRHRPNSAPVWHSSAERFDGSERIEDDKLLEKLRDAFLPRHLARFFFDAERGQNFGFGQQEIVEGISRILGLWSYAQLEWHLRQLIQQKIPRTFNPSAAHEAATKLAEVSGRVVTADGQISALRLECARLNRELTETKAELAELEERLRTLGALNPAELLLAQQNRAKLVETKARLESELNVAWEFDLPIALLGPYRRVLHDALLREEKRRDWETSKAAVEPKLPQLQRVLFDDPPEEHRLADSTQAFYRERLERALHELILPPPEGMADAIYLTDQNARSARIRAQLAGTPTSLRVIAELCAQGESVAATLREADTRLGQLNQDAAAIAQGAELHRRRGELTARAEHLEKQRTDLGAQLETLERELQELKREETNQSALTANARQGQSLIALAARYRELAGEIRARAAEQLRLKISEHVGDLWVAITERHQEFLGIDFDPDWNCFLLRRDGRRVSWEQTNTSAGQRQVRTLAFFEALRRLARLVPPLVVDTPLGRLDKEVKDSVLDQLYLTGHQTIILTTNSEIDPDSPLFQRIQKKLARAYTLHPQGEENTLNYQVRVTNDYFGKTL